MFLYYTSCSVRMSNLGLRLDVANYSEDFSLKCCYFAGTRYIFNSLIHTSEDVQVSLGDVSCLLVPHSQ